jgi:arylsulfatase A-like enzyme
LDHAEETPRFVRAAISRLKQMAQAPDRAELLWIHAGGLPIDESSIAYEDLYSDDAPQQSTETPEDLDEEEQLPEFPRFWRRNRASPRELADAQLRGAGWSAAGGVDTQVDWRKRRDLYSGQVTQWDTWIGRIVEAVAELRRESQVLLAFTAGAGEHLGEHAGLDSSALFEEQIHVPLIIDLPQDETLSGRRHQLTQSIDLPVTLLDWLQVGLPAGVPLDGQSLLPIIREDQPSAHEFVYIGDQHHVGVRTTEFYVRQLLDQTGLEPGEMIFLKPEDRWDADNMLRQYIDPADELCQKWREFVAGIRNRN